MNRRALTERVLEILTPILAPYGLARRGSDFYQETDYGWRGLRFYVRPEGGGYFDVDGHVVVRIERIAEPMFEALAEIGWRKQVVDSYFPQEAWHFSTFGFMFELFAGTANEEGLEQFRETVKPMLTKMVEGTLPRLSSETAVLEEAEGDGDLQWMQPQLWFTKLMLFALENRTQEFESVLPEFLERARKNRGTGGFPTVERVNAYVDHLRSNHLRSQDG